jgi:NAD-reducing hydrogenase small subunit
VSNTKSNGKVKVATVWLGGCAGCHMSFLDLDERLVDLAKLIDIVYSPIVDTKEIPSVDVGIVEGGICNEHNLHVLKDLRAKAKLIVSMGDCAGLGCVPMMRNQFELQDCLDRAYVAGESTALGQVPEDAELPKLMDKVRPIQEYVKVDAHIPGCPPNAEAIWCALTALLGGQPASFVKDVSHYD